MARSTPRVEGGALLGLDGRASAIVVGTPAWYAWLEEATAFAFASEQGSFTARRERGGRSGWYWKAYRKRDGVLHRAYLGKSVDLSLDRLNATASDLARRSVRGQIADALPSQTTLRDRDEHSFEDLSHPEQIFQLIRPELPSEFQPAGTVEARSPAPTAHSLPLLATKLNAPPPRSHFVPRPRLLERLQAGLMGKLTLIAAPAGFGKTTLASAWRATPDGSQTPVAWVSLDADDNDLTRFWSYVIAALELVASGVGATTLALLQTPQLPPLEAILTPLLNALSALSGHAVLVLDDYHVIDATAIHTAVAFLLDHLPPQLHLIIATRVDPPLPLTRLRARNELNELRAADLRFTIDEAAMFLTDLMGLPLSAADIAALEARTEGWIAGLQFAALAMRDRSDITSFIAAFTGSNRFVMDYLAEEVIDRLPYHLQTFLVQTSILDRLCGSLCDAVLLGDVTSPLPLSERPPAYSQALLEELERANLFLTALDGDRHWYRYHQLFAEVLRGRLVGGATRASVATLHRRASVWFEQHGLLTEAVSHALAAEDWQQAARLIEPAAQMLISQGEAAALERWISSVPRDVVHTRPRLCLAFAWALSFTARTDEMEAQLQEAARLLDDVDENELRPRADRENLLGELAALRAFVANRRHDLARTIALCREALTHISEQNLLLRSFVALTLGHSYLMSDDTVAAGNAFAEARKLGLAAGHRALAFYAMVNLGTLQVEQGRLTEGTRSGVEALQLATEPDGRQLPMAAYALAQLGHILYQRDILDAAARYLREAIHLGKQGGLHGAVAQGSTVLALTLQAQHDSDSALALLQEAEAAARQTEEVRIEEIIASRVRLSLAQGRAGEAANWAQEAGLIGDGDLTKISGVEQLTLARTLTTQYRPDAALALLDRLLQAAESDGRMGSAIEILVLRALALKAQSDTTGALIPLERALTLAEPEGYIRIFVDEGKPMAELLRAAHTRGILPDYVAKLLAAFPEGVEANTLRLSESIPYSKLKAQGSGLVEQLTDRELEVLRLIAAGQSNGEIAQALVVAVSTVKTHVNRIFGKLGATNRTQAVARARDLHIL